MAEDENNQQNAKGGKTMLEQAVNSIRDSQRKAAMGKLKEYLGEREKAMEVVNGIDDKIAELLAENGEGNEDDIRARLRGA